MYKNDIPPLRRRDLPQFSGRDYPDSVALIDLLRIRALSTCSRCQGGRFKFYLFITC